MTAKKYAFPSQASGINPKNVCSFARPFCRFIPF